MRKILFLAIAIHVCLLSAFAQVKVQNLLTENLPDPIGIDVQKPRFSWQLSGIEVPANTTATVFIPANNAASVTENGLALTGSKDIRVVGTDKDYVQVAVGSGRYCFEVTNQ